MNWSGAALIELPADPGPRGRSPRSPGGQVQHWRSVPASRRWTQPPRCWIKCPFRRVPRLSRRP